MTKREIEIIVEDGYAISATLVEPEHKPKAVIQINSGTGIPQELYLNFAVFLAENGFAVITYDYRGIGKSKREPLKNFNASILDWAKLDMTGVFQWIIQQYPDHKKVIIGHSMGGQLVGLMENHAQIDNIFFIAASTGYWKDMRRPFKYIMPALWFIIIPLHAKIFGYVKAKKIRQGENLPKGVGLQWRKWCIRPNYFEEFR